MMNNSNSSDIIMPPQAPSCAVEYTTAPLNMEEQVEEAMKHLDKKETRYYITAREVFPDLVKRETPALSFMRIERYDAPKAALRLANYWRFRKELFGDRWLLPMTQTGTGCLSMPEVELLRTGYRHFLRGEDGDRVVIMDYSRAAGKYDTEMNSKILMYGATVMTDEATQTNGITVIHIVNSAPTHDVLDMNRHSYEMIRTALPIKPKQTLVARAYVPGKEGILNYLTYQAARVNNFRTGLTWEQLIADSSQGTLALITSKGCDRKHIPDCLGGDWQYSEFDEWVRMRISIEDVMSASPAISNKLLAPVIPHSTRQLALLAKAGGVGTLQALKSKSSLGTNKQNYKTKKSGGAADPLELNRLYARRCYHKKKLEVLGLQEEVDTMQQNNHALRIEQARLERLLNEANTVLAPLGLAEQPQQAVPNHSQFQQSMQVPFVWNDFRLQQQAQMINLQQLQQQQLQLAAFVGSSSEGYPNLQQQQIAAFTGSNSDEFRQLQQQHQPHHQPQQQQQQQQQPAAYTGSINGGYPIMNHQQMITPVTSRMVGNDFSNHVTMNMHEGNHQSL